MQADLSNDCIYDNISIFSGINRKPVLALFVEWGISEMSANDSEPEPAPVSDDTGETEPPPTHSVDFIDTVERLKDRASASRRASIGNKTNSTVVAFLAVSALLMVVVGAENVVRRALVPDVADVATKRLEAANERARIATAEAAQKSATAESAKATVDSINEEKLAAKKTTEDAEELAAVRAAAFAANEDTRAALANAEATAFTRSDAHNAAKARSDGDIELFALAKKDLAIVEAKFAAFSQNFSLARSNYDRAKERALETGADLKNLAKLDPKRVKQLKDQLANARTQLDESGGRIEFLKSTAQNFDRTRAEVGETYDTARVAADKANLTVYSAGEELREAQATLAIAEEKAKRAAATLSDADDKATAARDLAKEPNAPDAIRKRNERHAKALADATAAWNIANAAQEAAVLARDTARELATAASSAPLPEDQKTDIQQAITRGGAVAGAIGIAILVLQIFVNSMRYYARLAEFYDAQADALLASGNDPALAIEFLEKFSPASIDFGKAPVSIYEKALDAVAKVTGPTAGRGNI